MDLRSRLNKLEQTMADGNVSPQLEERCVCFPSDEPPAFHWMAEVETAAAVRCPLHGVRFHAIDKPVVFQAKWLLPEDYAAADWPNHSPQYSKAWRASFTPGLWPAAERGQFRGDRTVTLILRDGTEIPSGGWADEWQTEKPDVAR
jgi:hypothetical protein